jgi:GT2 family glycosyltransferase
MSTTGIVILNYNGWRDTVECLVSILAIREPIHVIVIDNASPDGSEQHLAAWAESELPAITAERARMGMAPVAFERLRAGEFSSRLDESALPLTLMQTGVNGGYAAGNNAGIRLALQRGCDFVWLLNNDTVVEPEALSHLLARVRGEPRIGLCGSTLVYHERPDTVQACAGGRFRRWRGWSVDIGNGSSLDGRPDPRQVEQELSYINGASTLATRAFLEAVGPMEESYFLYWEEIDWAFRARGRFRLGYAPGSIVRHKVGASIGTRHGAQQSPLADFYMLRGAVLFCLRHSWATLPGTLFNAARNLGRLAAQGEWRRLRQQLRALAIRHYPADRQGVPKRTERAWALGS